MTIAVFCIGLFLIGLGILGIVSPGAFFEAVRFFQFPPVIYFATAVRIAFGAVLFFAAPKMRFTMVFRILGILIFLGGILTPFFENRMALAILDQWNRDGAPMLRLWAAIALALGIFIVYAAKANRRA